MKHILFVCSAGLTTAKVVAEIKHSLGDYPENSLEISSVGVSGIKDSIHHADIILLSPQSAYLKKTLTDITDKQIPIKNIPPQMYLQKDGKAILNFALERE